MAGGGNADDPYVWQ
ncbi:hypothetical protein [Sporosarcina sp. FA9]